VPLFPRDHDTFLRLLLEHWRVALAVFVAEAIGAAVAVAFIRPYGVWFFDLWMGAAVAAFPGFLLGAAWHLADVGRRGRAHRPFLLFIGAITLALPLFGWSGIDDEMIRSFPF